MRVKQPFFFWVGVLITLPLVYFLADRIHFVHSARAVMSTVENVRGENSRCGGKRRRNCTKFYAQLSYRVDEMRYRLEVSAGSTSGHNQSISNAKHYRNQLVPVAYDPRRPQRAYRDAFWDIWGAPLGTFFVQLFAFAGGFSEKRRDRD